MFKDFRALGERITNLQPWAAGAMILAVLLVGYCLLLGARYWQATEEIPDLGLKVKNLTRTLRLGASADRDLTGKILEEGRTLEELTNTFHYPESDHLINIISEEARETSIALLVVNADVPNRMVIDEISYLVNSFNLTVQGDSKDIFKFITRLHDRVPVISVTSLRMADLDDNPSAQIGLQALLDPKEVTEDEGGD